MEITTEILYIVAVLAVIFRIWAQAGYGLLPFYKEGKFQVNIVGIVVLGLLTAIPVVNTMVIVGQDPITVIVTTFMTVYAVPQIADKLGTKLTPNPEEPEPEQPAEA